MDEKTLIEGCLRKDKNCQKELYLRYSRKMMGVCFRYSSSQFDAEDTLQEGFIKVFNHLSSFKFTGSFEGWIRKIMVNTALKKIKSNEYKQELISDSDESAVDPSVLSHLSEKEIIQMIQQLPVGYRTVFNLFAIEGYNHKEIAELLGITESTSRSQLVKARRMLQEKITNPLSLVS